MASRKLLKVLGQSLTLFTASQLSPTVHSETKSFLEGATVTSNSPSYGTGLNHLIDGTFKALVLLVGEVSSDITLYADYSVWLKIDLLTSRTFETALILNNAEDGSGVWAKMRFGTSYFCVGDNPGGPKATGNSCTTPFYDGGFITVRLTGRYVFLLREGQGNNAMYSINEVRLYGLPNLVGSATIITSYTPIVD